MSAANGNDPSWRPDEPADILRDEELFFQGAAIASVACGAVAVLAIECFFMLARKVRKITAWRDALLLAYVVFIFCLHVVYAGVNIQLAQQTYVDDRNYPGGPAAYQAESTSRLTIVGDACIVVSAMLSDTLLLWRCVVIYQSTFVPRLVTYGLAAAFWIAEVVLGTLLLVELTHIEIFGSVNFILSLWSFSLALNVLATLLICGRLAWHRYQLKDSFGKEIAAPYTSIISMFVESEALYTAYLILFIIPLIRNNILVYALIQSPSAVQSVAAMMIVYRVADGKAWTTSTHVDLATSTVRFNPQTAASMSQAVDDMTWKAASVKDVDSDIEVGREIRADSRNASNSETGP